MLELKIKSLGPPTRLGEAPSGLFLYGDVLALKTEYRGECFDVTSGERFWGPAFGDCVALAALIVQPLAVDVPIA